MGYNLDWFVKQHYSTRAFWNLERLNNLIRPMFLALDHKNLYYLHRRWLTNLGVPGGIQVPLRSTFLRLGLAFNTRYTSFRFESFIITFWGALLVDLSRWQSSTFEKTTGALHFENKSKTVSSRALSAMLPGMPDISRHSLLEYCSFS